MMKPNPGKCHNRVFLPRLVNGLLVFVMLLSILFTGFSAQAASSLLPPLDEFVYLPLVLKNSQPATPKMVGVIAKGYWVTDIQTKLKPLDTWAGKKHSIVGWFYNIVTETPSQVSVDYNFGGQLENLWVNGYVSFVNLSAEGTTAYAIASGQYDTKITYIAKAYAAFVNKGGGRRAFIAPLQEMNGYWVSYGEQPTNFKLAYDRIRTIFAGQGIDAAEIWWTFAPNGYTNPGQEFELYYPGDAKVDVNSFSSYNFGFCPVGDLQWRAWKDYTLVFEPYVERMRSMAPNKPIIIAQTATSAQYPSAYAYNVAWKNTWLVDSYNYLANEPNVLAVLYFNLTTTESGECDFEVYTGSTGYDGYKTGVGNPKFLYYAPATLSQLNLMGTP